jgi:hypothetical protein
MPLWLLALIWIAIRVILFAGAFSWAASRSIIRSWQLTLIPDREGLIRQCRLPIIVGPCVLTFCIMHAALGPERVDAPVSCSGSLLVGSGSAARPRSLSSNELLNLSRKL